MIIELIVELMDPVVNLYFKKSIKIKGFGAVCKMISPLVFHIQKIKRKEEVEE